MSIKYNKKWIWDSLKHNRNRLYPEVEFSNSHESCKWCLENNVNNVYTDYPTKEEYEKYNR